MTDDMNGAPVDTRPPTFQEIAHDWAKFCFGEETVANKNECCARFLEEALELVQSLGFTRTDAYQLVNHVFDRDEGRPSQEVGGVCVTLAVLCGACDLNMLDCSIEEMNRVRHPDVMKRIRQKNANKPQFSPLPGVPDDG